MFNEKQCLGSSKPATASSHKKTNLRTSTSCHCRYIKSFKLCYYLQKIFREKRILTGKAMLLSLSWAPGELKSLEFSDATNCGYRRVNQIFGTETVTLQICSMIISNMICFLIQITKADSWNPTNDSSYPDTRNQTPCTWRLLCGCKNCKDLKKLIFS